MVVGVPKELAVGSPRGTTPTCVFIVALCLKAAALLILAIPAFWAVTATAGLAAAAFKMVKDVRGGKM
jgi:hypothetical protein